MSKKERLKKDKGIWNITESIQRERGDNGMFITLVPKVL